MQSEDVSIALQNYLEAEVQRRNLSYKSIALADFLDILLSSKVLAGYDMPSDRDYLDRIAQVAYERYTARRIAQDVPTMIIVPARLTKRQADELLGNRLNYVMIFGAESIYFQDTVHALTVDSHCSGGVNVLGAHINWISSDGKSVERALAVDETGLVKEIAFQEPVPIHIVQILHLPIKCERQLHKELSAHFRDRGIPQINPYAGGSERADDKAWAHALWDECGRGIASPKYTLIPQHSSPEEIVERLRSFIENTKKPDVVVQPNRGTEGYKVEKFSVKAGLKPAPTLSPIVRYIKDQVLPEDDAIVRESRGNVRYSKGTARLWKSAPVPPGLTGGNRGQEAAPTLLNVAFRINVAWNGSEFVAESGYAQVAKDDRTFPASRGRGGTIVNINEALANLYYPRGESRTAGKPDNWTSGFPAFSPKEWVRLIPTDEDIEAMKMAAINAAYGLNAGLGVENYLKHMGIDILLEVEETEANIANVIPVVLEANSRPAGLSQSSEIVGISSKTPQPRISTEMFKSVGSMSL